MLKQKIESHIGNYIIPQMLVIDDNDIDRMIISQDVRKLKPDWRITCVNGLKEASCYLKTTIPAVILCDVNLECEVGFSLSDIIAELKLDTNIPCAFMTGVLRDQDLDLVENQSLGPLLKKPMNSEQSRVFYEIIFELL